MVYPAGSEVLISLGMRVAEKSGIVVVGGLRWMEVGREVVDKLKVEVRSRNSCRV
jgi:hypothetical protein